MATRCCSPPESWLGRWSSRWARPTRSSISSARRRRSEPDSPAVDQRQGDVVPRGGAGQQVEALEDEADHLVAQPGQLGGRERRRRRGRRAAAGPRWAGPGRRADASASTCPSRTARRWPRSRPARWSATRRAARAPVPRRARTSASRPVPRPARRPGRWRSIGQLLALGDLVGAAHHDPLAGSSPSEISTRSSPRTPDRDRGPHRPAVADHPDRVAVARGEHGGGRHGHARRRPGAPADGPPRSCPAAASAARARPARALSRGTAAAPGRPRPPAADAVGRMSTVRPRREPQLRRRVQLDVGRDAGLRPAGRRSRRPRPTRPISDTSTMVTIAAPGLDRIADRDHVVDPDRATARAARGSGRTGRAGCRGAAGQRRRAARAAGRPSRRPADGRAAPPRRSGARSVRAPRWLRRRRTPPGPAPAGPRRGRRRRHRSRPAPAAPAGCRPRVLAAVASYCCWAASTWASSAARACSSATCSAACRAVAKASAAAASRLRWEADRSTGRTAADRPVRPRRAPPSRRPAAAGRRASR